MTDILLLAFVFLVAGIIAVPIVSRLALGSVLGYLIAGVVISPVLELLDVNVESIQSFAELGVVMMLFLVGLELEPKKFWALRARLFGLGGGQIGLTATVVMTIAMLFGYSWSIALTIGLVFTLSSTAIVLQTLAEKGLISCDGGQSSFAVLLTQDIAAIPMLAFIPLLSSPELLSALQQSGTQLTAVVHGSTFSLVESLNGWQTVTVNIAAIATVIAGGSFLITPLFRFIGIARLRELFTATALVVVIAITLLMSLVGLSPALGAFLAGMVLANSAYRHELESDIAPFKGLLLGLFFMTVGAGINFNLLAENFLAIMAATFGLIVVKIILLLLLGYLFNIRGPDKWLFAVGLSQVGEFGFVLLSLAVNNAAIPALLAEQMVLIIALSMMLTPALFTLHDRIIVPRYAAGQERREDNIPNNSKIIIAGSGRVGGLVDRILRAGGFETTVIDFNSKHLDAMERFGIRNYFGDATRPDLLAAAGITEARLLIVAIDDAEQISRLVKYVVSHYPDLHVIARAVHRHHVYDLYAHGCRDIIRETYDSTLRMGRCAFEALDIPTAKAEKMISAFNDYDREAMITVADAYRMDIPAHENEAYIARVRQTLAQKQPQLQATMKAIRTCKE